MKNIIKLLILLLGSIPNCYSQYNVDFSQYTFYDSTSLNDLHYTDGWIRDGNNINITGNRLVVTRKSNNSDTSYIESDYFQFSLTDTIRISSRISNNSGNNKKILIYLTDSLSPDTLIGSIIYNNASPQFTTNSIALTNFGEYRVKLVFIIDGNNNQEIQLQSYQSNVFPILLPYQIKSENIIDDCNLCDIRSTGGIIIYPNPCSNILHINGIINPNIKIYNNNGILIHSENKTNKIDISHLIKGIYYIYIYNYVGDIINIEKIILI